MWGNYYGHMGGLGFGFGFVFMIIFWALIFFAVFALIRGFSGHACGHDLGEHKQKEKSALDILKQRYAKGEITKEDFEKMKKDLE
ncbi:MAG: hypothetical protein UX02_C0001G0336 [Candidatus Moranbacteria bacterium GW2011_GWC1_45_18]|nr:MAG: hypothetical protein UT79_C0002G0061 [Candidatus Moranbacteria bacterium GW2011_GWC2_40_12]KKT33788.1 MAG: hypothetical protein UW19_C0005G0034 [Candidatus Moranbacteria bacterium GW2011_GWF2_44_10]KKT69930.1 MAG: hypothetical protein UW66_C0057G0005 [Candidatus Moranbacteria bacterium GW2011_GWF1_44_4]KKU00888.1 MAG: hypothetical protein UX02_C0001G0336 [Candidatus Moranbacteria bacterium GW2011_GWC1_45_18]OGI23533.1 MAG: hypothetical protein A2194_03825 [Candidatus Moranbacteria bacte